MKPLSNGPETAAVAANTVGERAALPGVSVIVPVYNSRDTLRELVERLQRVLSAKVARHEVLLVNDGSADDSWTIIREFSSADAMTRGVDLMRNHGQHNALLCGIRLARYDTIVTMDDDLQNSPEDVPLLLDALSQGYEVVYGTPRRSHAGLWRTLASRSTKLILSTAMGADTASRVSTFRAFRTEVRNGFADFHAPYVNMDVLLTWGAARFGSVPVDHEARRAGRSNYTFRKLLRHTMNMVTGFSTLPLQLASLIGFGMAFFGLAVLAYVLIRYFIEGGSIPGFPFLASVIAIFSGTQLFALGIIGEYLARMFLRTMGQPCYTVRRTTF